MIKTLRRRFIAIAMCSIFVVLVLIIGSINIINYVNINHSLNQRLSILSENDGHFPRKRPNNFYRDMSVESPYDTRYFTVTINGAGQVQAVRTDNIAAITEKEAANYAIMLLQKGKTHGYIDKYKFCTMASDENSSTMYIFLDCWRELRTFKTFLFASVAISLIGLSLVFLLVLFFSRLVVRPMAESYEKQKHFITDASHEIKTPLTIIDANTEVLEMENGENEWTQSIRNQIKRLTELTNKLVFLSRMDEEAPRLTMLDFSLSDAVTETAQPFLSVAAAQQKNFSMDIAPNITFCGDESTIRQMISLLLDNAMKYSSDEGTIHLSLSENSKNSIITVWNSVDKISIGRHDELFERFYRSDASRNSATGGHGIGLSVTKAIVLSHKGKITANSHDGKSICFTIIL